MGCTFIIAHSQYTQLPVITRPLTQLHHPVVVAVVSGSRDGPLIEGQFITYSCPPGFILNGPNVLIYMGNGEWEPDPGQVDA